LVVVACGASAAVGYWFGFRDAWPLGIAAELLPRGSMAVYLLKGLGAGKQGGVIVSLEADVDSGLIWGHEILGHPMCRAWGPIWDLNVCPEYEQYVREAADYRKLHPSPFKPDAFDVVPKGQEEDREVYRDLAKGTRANKAKIDAMIEHYGKK